MKPVEPMLDEHEKDWRAEKLNEDWASNCRAVERLNRSVNWIAQRWRDGEITAFWRFQSGGGPVRPMRADEWNIDDPLSRFVSMGGSKRYCHEFKHTGPYDFFVFFEKRQLLDDLKRQPDSPLIVGEADLSRLSPYLQMAVRITLGLCQCIAHQPVITASSL